MQSGRPTLITPQLTPPKPRDRFLILHQSPLLEPPRITHLHPLPDTHLLTHPHPKPPLHDPDPTNLPEPPSLIRPLLLLHSIQAYILQPRGLERLQPRREDGAAPALAAVLRAEDEEAQPARAVVVDEGRAEADGLGWG